MCVRETNILVRALPPQLHRAPDYEFGGQEFESLRARQKSNKHQYNSNSEKDDMQNKISSFSNAAMRGDRSIPSSPIRVC